ncbi:MAG: molybdopterin-dependent oxidoreductase, partial [Thermoleophilia bacterium]
MTALADKRFAATLLGLDVLLKRAARKHPDFAARLRERDITAQIALRDGSKGRYFEIRGGKVKSASGIHPSPDCSMVFDTADVAARLLKPSRDTLEFISALKNFEMALDGSDEAGVWFSQTLQMMLTAGTEYGVPMGGGVRRYTSNTNGGPVFVFVKDGKILRITPIEFDDSDPESWTIEAHGRA